VYKPERRAPHRVPRPSPHTSTPSYSSDNLKYNNAQLPHEYAGRPNFYISQLIRKPTCKSRYFTQ